MLNLEPLNFLEDECLHVLDTEFAVDWLIFLMFRNFTQLKSEAINLTSRRLIVPNRQAPDVPHF